MKKSFVNLENARHEDQLKLMEQIQKGAYCPFCPEHQAKAELMPVLKGGNYWSVRKNRWPYVNTRVHLIFISNAHMERMEDIPPKAWQELLALAKWAEKKYHIKGGAINLRFGDSKKNGGTVDHLHVQLLTAKISNKKFPHYQPVRFRVG